MKQAFLGSQVDGQHLPLDRYSVMVLDVEETQEGDEAASVPPCRLVLVVLDGTFKSCVLNLELADGDRADVLVIGSHGSLEVSTEGARLSLE